MGATSKPRIPGIANPQGSHSNQAGIIDPWIKPWKTGKKRREENSHTNIPELTFPGLVIPDPGAFPVPADPMGSPPFLPPFLPWSSLEPHSKGKEAAPEAPAVNPSPSHGNSRAGSVSSFPEQIPTELRLHPCFSWEWEQPLP